MSFLLELKSETDACKGSDYRQRIRKQFYVALLKKIKLRSHKQVALKLEEHIIERFA